MDPQRWTKLESLYHAALEKGPGERASYLAEACVDEPELRLEVEGLLACADRELNSPLGTGERWPSGFRLGSYEIIDALGAGGMGEVYRARDTKLRREVAIKTLPREFQNDASRLARFEREARLLASLNHPNIAAIYGLEQIDGIRFLVLELVDGPTLSERLKSGPIEVSEVLRIAIGIAEALEAAHDNNVVHRDLKPGNVKITPVGKVKVLDFGLAKALGDAPDSRAEFGGSNVSTVTQGETKAGVVMGTPAYMSPEQAEGKPTDKRSDVWSFGVVLYEMLSGKRCFDGKTTSHVLVHILEQEPDWQALPASVPVGLRPLLERCLTKDPAERLRDIGDVRVQLRALEKEAKPATKSGRVAAVEKAGSSAPAKQTRRAWIWPTAGGAFAMAALAREFLYFRPKPAPVVPPMRFEIAGPSNARLTGALVISPDGHNLAFLATGADNVSRLWVRPLANLESRPLEGTEGADGVPFWSPDSRYIVFQTAQGPRKLHRIEAAGGPPLTLCSVSSALAGGFWTSENRIIIGTLGGRTLLELAGGQLMPFTTDDSLDHSDAYPSLLPDGRHFVYSHVNVTSPEKGGIYLGTLNDKAEQRSGKRLLADASATVFAPSPDPDLGYILFVRRANAEALSGTLMAQPFDNRKLELTGDAVPIAEQVSRSGFSASATGVLVYGVGALNSFQSARGFGVNGELTWFDRQGNVLKTVLEPDTWRALALSPDNTKLAYERRNGLNTYIRVYEFARGTDAPLTSDPLARFPVWNVDGSRIAFFSERKQPGIYERASNGAGEDDLLARVDQGRVFIPYSGGWSRDFMLLTSDPAAPLGVNLWVLPLTGTSAADRKIVPLVKSESHDRGARFSPDNRWFAYFSDKNGNDEVYIRAFNPNFIPGSGNPSPGADIPVSTNGGTAPQWSRNGKEIFYIAPDGRIMAVDVSNKFKPGIPNRLFNVPLPAYFLEVADDGQHQRFLIPVAGGTASEKPAPYKVVLNWTSLLKR